MGLLLKGLLYGMALQLAIGPVCLYVFNTAVSIGIVDALLAAIGVTIADAIYMSLALFGITAFVRHPKAQKAFKIISAFILFAFGVTLVLGAVGLFPESQSENRFLFGGGSAVSAFLLTMSNPMTILFWSGVFGTKIAEANLSRKKLMVFALGALSSTPIFLSAIGLLGFGLKTVMPELWIDALNIFIGIGLIAFALISLFRKPKTDESK